MTIRVYKTRREQAALVALYPTSSHTPEAAATLGTRNLRVAQALAVFNSTLAYKVLDCWRPPFNRPCTKFRFCEGCARYRQRKQADTHGRRLALMVTPFFLTLTIPCGKTLTRKHLDRFRKRLTSLRRWRRFGRSVRGGFYTIEIKLGEKSGRWNIHAHVILDLADLTLDEAEIKKAWHRRTGGYMVKFGPIKAGTLARVLSYATKPQELPSNVTAGTAIDTLARAQEVPLDPARLHELYKATWNFAGSGTFGNLSKGYGKPPVNRRAPGAA